MITKIYWKIRIFFLALRWIPQINLGDQVWYQGKKYYVYNGVRCESWRLSGLDDGKDKHNTGWVERWRCKKVWTPMNILKSFRSGWNFYMTSWFKIWCREGITPWMKACKIWPWPSRK